MSRYRLPLFLALPLLMAFSCQTNTTRRIKLCLIDEPNSSADCAEKDTKFQLQYPSQLTNWFAFDQRGFDLFMSRKEQCISRPRSLPPSQNTLKDMNACQVSLTCHPSLSLNEYYATDPLGWGKMRDFLESCGERHN